MIARMRISPAALRVALTIVVTTTIALGYALLAPRWYRASVSIVPSKPSRGPSSIAGMLSPDLASLAGGLDVTGSGNDIQRIAAVLQSTTVSDAVIARFGLRERYGEKYQETARAELWDHCGVKPFPKPNLLVLSCEDRDPVFLMSMLQFFSEYGNETFRKFNVTGASEEVRFLEKRVAELTRTAEEVAARMRAFQERNQLVDIETQTRAAVSSVAKLESQRIEKQLELDFARTYSSGEEASMRQLRSQLSVMDDALRGLTGPRETDPERTGSRRPREALLPPILAVPALRAEYESLFRERRVAEAILVVAMERLENARANEARDVSAFLVLDPPVVPTKHSRPLRGLTTVAGVLLGVCVGFALEWRRSGFDHLAAIRAIAGRVG